MIKNKAFEERRKLVLTEMDDRSRKGSVDSAIVELLAAVNGDSRFCSLSSCSGRIVVYRSQELRQDRPEDSGPVHDEVDATLDDIASDEEVRKKHKKKNCDLMLVSHERVSLQQVRDSVFGGTDGEDGCRPGVITLKFEPLILHVQCSDLEAAKHLLSISVAASCRNSGISLGKKSGSKVVLAVRCTPGMDAPLSDEAGNVLVSEQHLELLVNLANRQFDANSRRIKAFLEEFHSKNRNGQARPSPG